MPLRLDDPELREKVAALQAAGYHYSDQHDLRIRWLERAIARLQDDLAHQAKLIKALNGGHEPALREEQDGLDLR